MNQKEKREWLITHLLDEFPLYNEVEIPNSELEQKTLLRGLMNVREPALVSNQFIKIQDAYLKREIKNIGITSLKDLEPIEKNIYLWKGDITTLEVDGIVNAANSSMLGCFIPNHRCIDNAIHSYAGVQLRMECHELMDNQNYLEPTGKAKITDAYNLPCKYVIHTVGPIIQGNVSENACNLLESCYRSCLKIALNYQLKSIAFCCISTGEYHFPNDLAAEIAVKTTKAFLKENQDKMEVVFNVFKETDYQIYRRLLATN